MRSSLMPKRPKKKTNVKASSTTTTVTEFGDVKLSADSWISYRAVPADLVMTDDVFAELTALQPEERKKIKVFGKDVYERHKSTNFGTDYFYSGVKHKALPIEHPFLQRVLKFVRTDSKLDMNQLLVNWYVDEKDATGLHSDSEKGLNPDAPIYSFSYGAERQFVVNKKGNKSTSLTKADFLVPLVTNTYLIMGGACQKEFIHAVFPQRKKPCGMRINLTFRHVII